MTLEDLFVLVIEPSNMQRGIIVNRLKALGIVNIDEFEEGAAAITAMQQQTPDLVLSAMHLPDMTGTEVVTQMREQAELSDITFLLISSETHYRYLEPIRQAGAIAILPKPFDENDFRKALQSTLHYICDKDEITDRDTSEYENLRVLLVDDSKFARKYLNQILTNIGIESIVEAEDGAQGLALLEQERFDLIVSDYNMPNVDGKEMVEHIRASDDQPTIPIMMVTSEQNESQLAAIQAAGVSALISKPLSYDMMKQLIEKLVFDSGL